MNTPKITTIQHIEFHQRRFENVKEAYKNNSVMIASSEYVSWSNAFKRFLEDEYPDEAAKLELFNDIRGKFLVTTYEDLMERIGNSIELMFEDLIENVSNKSIDTKS